MRLCILGNSHVASLKSGWEALADSERAGVTPTFFASRNRAMEALRAQNGRLVPTTEELRQGLAFTSGGLTEIDLDAYDVFLVYGLFVPAYRAAGAFHSQACQMAALLDHFRPRPGIKLASTLRSATQRPVLVGHDPLPSDPAITDQPEDAPVDHYAVTLDMVNRMLFNPVRLHMVAQPAETRVRGRPFVSAERFSRGSRRLAVGDGLDHQPHAQDDRVHMNADFGTLYLRDLLQHLTILR